MVVILTLLGLLIFMCAFEISERVRTRDLNTTIHKKDSIISQLKLKLTEPPRIAILNPNLEYRNGWFYSNVVLQTVEGTNVSDSYFQDSAKTADEIIIKINDIQQYRILQFYRGKYNLVDFYQ